LVEQRIFNDVLQNYSNNISKLKFNFRGVL
jgi:hypothetical protein